MCQEIHSSVAIQSKRFMAELSRYNYVTPTSYLELLQIFNKLLVLKKSEISISYKRTKSGLDKVMFDIQFLIHSLTSAAGIHSRLCDWINYIIFRLHYLGTRDDLDVCGAGDMGIVGLVHKGTLDWVR